MAKRLSKEAFDASQRFIEANARPLEIARLRHHFHGASHEPVMAALKTFQNADGGFGHGLEPDLRAPESSALCTSIAFQVIRSMKVPAEDAVVMPTISYLLETLDRQTGHWRIIPPSAEKSPHAPWWTQTGRGDALDTFSLNPTAEMLGYLYDYRQHVPSDILSYVSDAVMHHLSGLEQIEMHDLLCCLRLLQTEDFPENDRVRIQDKLSRLVEGTVARDPAQWEGYALRPLQVVDDPTSPFITGIEDAVALNLDYEISTQNEDGSWTPPWAWGEDYPEDWEKARLEWCGVITLEKLLMLRRFNRVETIA